MTVDLTSNETEFLYNIQNRSSDLLSWCTLEYDGLMQFGLFGMKPK